MAELSELTIESRTQSADTIKKIMEDSGYDQIEATEQTDTPPKPPADKPAPPAAAPAAAVPAAAEPAAAVPDPDDEEDPPEPAAEGQPHHKPSGAARRARKIEALKSENDILKAEREELARKLAALSAPPAAPAAAAALPAAAPAPAVEDDPEPKLDDFESQDDPYAAYSKALARWGVREELRDQAKQKAERHTTEEAARRSEIEQSERTAAETETKAMGDRWAASAEKSQTLHPDFNTTMSRNIELGEGKAWLNPVMRQMAYDYDEPAELAYWLVTHLDEATRIESKTRLPANFTQLGPRARQRAIRVAEDAAREAFDRIVAELPAAPSPEASPETAARRETPVAAAAPVRPAPVPRPKAEPPKPVGSRGGAVTKRYPQDYSIEEQRAMPIDEVRRLRALQQ